MLLKKWKVRDTCCHLGRDQQIFDHYRYRPLFGLSGLAEGKLEERSW